MLFKDSHEVPFPPGSVLGSFIQPCVILVHLTALAQPPPPPEQTLEPSLAVSLSCLHSWGWHMFPQLLLAAPPPRSPHLQESFSHTCAQWSPNCDSGSQECHLLDVSSQFPRDKEGDLGAEPSLSSGTESCFPPAPSHGGKVWKFIVGSLACEVYIQ